MITHALGATLSIMALVWMIIISQGDPWKVTSAAIFGSSLFILYMSSTLYHSFGGLRVKSFFQILDHSAIYLLIAGTYTPLALITLRGPWGWSLFGIVWAMAIGGILVKALMKNNREHWLSTALYIAMGWLAVIAIKPMYQGLPLGGLILLIAGGLSYTGGVVFFIWRKLMFNHAIWHLFVIGGSACHALAVILYIF